VDAYQLQKCVSVRWWSDVTMLRSLIRMKEAIKMQVIKNEAPVPDIVNKLDWGTMEALLEVVEPFAHATELMEADKHPTIGLVVNMV
ncbi:unnamed protein product, partial [Laminaria digitata]